MSVWIAERAETIKERELVRGQEALRMCFTKERLKRCPVEVVTPRHAKQPNKHMLKAHLTHDRTGHEESVEEGLARLLERQAADGAARKDANGFVTILIEKKTQSLGAIGSASCLISLEQRDQLGCVHGSLIRGRLTDGGSAKR
jgi:hypothetical protein